MGLFGKENKIHESTQIIKDYEIRQMGNTKLLFDFEEDCTFKHGEKLTNLIKARLLDGYEKQTSIAPDSAEYICFELPTNMELGELADRKIFNILNYLGKFEDLKQNKYNHIGIIDRLEDERYELFNPTKEVVNYVENVLDEQIKKSDTMFSQRLKQQEFKNRIAKPASEYIESNKAIREDRKKDYFLEEQFRYKIGDRIYTDYRGIDTVDGKILNIHRLEKLEEQPQEILYSAIIQKREEYDKTELKSLQLLPSGFPVMFTLETQIEEITNGENKEQIKKLLDLVSDIPQEQLNKNEIKFIGGLDNDGRIVRTNENCSEIIKEKIEKEKERYKKERTDELERN